MSITRATEIERKYDVDGSARIPDLSSLGTVQTVQPATLWSIYYDTADGALADHLMTLRRRTGDLNEGWHLKTPAVDGRTEFHAELADDLPRELADRVRSVIRDRELVEVARMSTLRSVIRLLDEDGAVVAEVADDVVLTIEVPAGIQRAWREWEIELQVAATGDHNASEALLDSIEKALRAAGATPSKSASKLAHATGHDSLGHETATARKSSTSLEVVTAILAGLVAALVAVDPRARDDEPDAVHTMRVIVRRIRSVLAAFHTVLNREVTDGIRERLRELGSVLGGARDAEMRRQRGLGLLDGHDVAQSDLDLHRRLVDDALGEYRVRHEEMVEYLDSAGYLRLLDDLDELIARPPAMPDAVSNAMPDAMPDARHELRAALRRQLRRARKSLPRGHDDDLAAIHEARKAARRLRYVAESLSKGAGAVLGKKTRALAKTGHELQSASGDHRDAVLYVDHLHETARAAAEAGEDTARYGALVDAERHEASAALDRFAAAAKELRRLRL